MFKPKRIPMVVMVAIMFLVSIAFWDSYVRAGTLEFDGVPVDLTTSTSEDLVIVPGVGGNTQIGDGTGSNTNATSNDDLHITGGLEVDGVSYLDSGMVSGSNLISDTDSTDSLGMATIAWINLYVDAIRTVSGTNLTLLPTSAYTIIGDAGTAGYASTNDDLFISGVLEVDGTFYADDDLVVGTSDFFVDDSLGRVGIGTTGPGAILEVKNLVGGATPTSVKIIAGTTSPDNFALQIQDYAEADKVVVLDSGRVGIGITAPLADLHVAGDVKIDGTLTMSGLVVDDTYVPYTGANTAVNLGSETLTTTGTITGNILTDGTLTITGGDITTTGGITAGTFNDITLSDTGGADNVFIDTIPASITTALGCIGIGGDSLSALTEGNYNIVIGLNSGDDLEDGDNNVLIGRLAGHSLTSQGTNVHVGNETGRLSTGSNNCYVGYGAGKGTASEVCSGSFNNAFGQNALANVITGQGNTAQGNNAGKALTTGNYNIFLGRRAGYYNTTEGGRLIIDSYGRTDLADQESEAIISGLMNTDPTNQTLALNAAVTIPYTLDVTGTGTFGEIIDSGLTASLGVYTDANKQLTSTPPASGALGYWDRTGTVLSPVTAGDDITTTGDITADSFIGSDFALHKATNNDSYISSDINAVLFIAGHSNAGFYLTNQSPPLDYDSSAFGMLSNPSFAQHNIFVSDTVGNHINITSLANRNKDYDHAVQTNPTIFIHSETSPDVNNTQFLALYHDTVKGVLNTDTHGLDIRSKINVVDDINEDNNYHLHLLNKANDNGEGVGLGFGVSDLGGVGASITHTREGAYSYGNLAFNTRPSGGSVTQRMVIGSDGAVDLNDNNLTTTGNIGIGTTSPEALLEVKNLISGTTPTSLKIIAGSTSADNFALQIQDYAGADKLVVLDNGRVGIGTTAPGDYDLYVEGNAYLDGLTVSDGTLEFGGALDMGGFDIDNVGTITADTLTDGTLTITGGDITTTGGITAGTFNDITLSDTGGADNVFIDTIPASITSAFYNIGIADLALSLLEDGLRNISIGRNSGSAITSGDDNVIIGVGAGQAVSTTNSNAFLGYQAGRYSGGTGNSYFGREAGSGATGVDSYNNAMGLYALYKIVNGHSNTAQGNSAGYNLTSGDLNIFLGRRAGYRITTENNRLIVDNQDRADAATEITDSIIYGVMDATPANQTLRLNAAVTIPYTLDVTGTGTFGEIIDSGLTASLGVYTDASKQLTSTAPSSGALGYWDRTGTVLSPVTAGDDITTTGKLGASVLENTVGDLKVQPNANNGDIYLFNEDDVADGTKGGSLNIVRNAPEGDHALEIGINSSKQAVINHTEDIIMTSSGFVQIRSYDTLAVNLKSNVELCNQTGKSYVVKQSGDVGAVGLKYVQHAVATDGWYKTTREDSEILGHSIDMDVDLLDNDLTTTGNIGIGTTSPEALLEVKNLISGTTPTSMKIIAGSTSADNFALQIQDYAGADKLVVLDNGRVGIGTTAPGDYDLYVVGDAYLGGLTVSDGTLEFGGALDMGGFDIDNVGTITADTLTDGTLSITDGALTTTGTGTFGNAIIDGGANGTLDFYVDSSLANIRSLNTGNGMQFNSDDDVRVKADADIRLTSDTKIDLRADVQLNANNLTTTGGITANTLTDGTLTITGGALTTTGALNSTELNITSTTGTGVNPAVDITKSVDGTILRIKSTASGPAYLMMLCESDRTVNKAFGTLVTGNVWPRFSFATDGKMTWGIGTGGYGDTNLYRDSANALKTDDSLLVGAALGVSGTGTFGEIIDSGLTASLGVYTDANKQLTSTAPSSGALGYWDRTGTVLSPVTAGDDITTTGKFGATVLENTAGDLKIQPDAQGDVRFFEDKDYGAAEDSNSFYIDRNSTADGDHYLRLYVGQAEVPTVYSDIKLKISAGDDIIIDTKDGAQVQITNMLEVGKSGENFYTRHFGGVSSGGTKYVQNVLDTDGYYKTTPEDANVLGWNIDLPVDLNDNNLTTTGNVGIGTTSPEALLEVKNLISGTTPTSMKIIAGSTSADNFALQIQDYAGADKLVVLDNGRVGIGTTAPGDYDLYVVGDAYLGGLTVSDGTLEFGGALDMGGFDINNVGTITADTLTDGTLTITGGDLSTTGKLTIDSSVGTGTDESILFEKSVDGTILRLKSTDAGATIYTMFTCEADNTSDKAFGTAITGNVYAPFLFKIDGAMEWGSGAGLRDTNLYRDSANVLKTDDSFIVGASVGIGTSPTSGRVLDVLTDSGASSSESILFRTSVDRPILKLKSTDAGATTYTMFACEADNLSDKAFGTGITGNIYAPFLFKIDGGMEWGSGSGGRDTNLYRDSASVLKTDDSLLVGAALGVSGTGTFGEIIDSGLTASLGVYTDASKQLTSSPPAGGIIGYWSKTGTTISTATGGDDIVTTGDGSFTDVKLGVSETTRGNLYFYQSGLTGNTKLYFDSNHFYIANNKTTGQVKVQNHFTIDSSSSDNYIFRHSGYVAGTETQIEHVLDTDGYYKTTPKDANVLGWNIDLPVDLNDNNLTTTGNIGIGTTSPEALLEVKNLISGTTPTSLKIIAGSTSADNFALQIQDYAGADKLVVLDNGRVGIGTTDPQVALDVTGDIRLSGRVRQGSLGDLAEMMVLSGSIVNPANIGLEASDVIANQKSKTEPVVLKGQEGYQDYLVQRPEAGDVVIIAIDGGIKRSHQAYATNTAGIISTNPAQILQDGLENSAPVALSGVVPCKVSAENGVIMPGDLLVASTLPGHAMKAGNAPPVGSIIGKALNRLEDAVGVVRVLVMMQ